jgi:hypothetical protein
MNTTQQDKYKIGYYDRLKLQITLCYIKSNL